jgi:hypothetical protein
MKMLINLNNISNIKIRDKRKKEILNFLIKYKDNYQIVIFKNTFKKESKHPDYRIFQSKPMESRAPEVESKSAEHFEDDIPF